jgi:hypothetical protein
MVSGQSYKRVREKIARRYQDIEIVSLPDKVFGKAQHETALVIGKRPREDGNITRVLHRKVSDQDWCRHCIRLSETHATKARLSPRLHSEGQKTRGGAVGAGRRAAATRPLSDGSRERVVPQVLE